MIFIFSLFVEKVPVENIRGISPNTKSQYLRSLKWTKGVFQCFDKSKTIPIERVNDGYCDCLDGSDEPGTNACGTGLFYCRNRGSYPKEIPKWLVGDGVCDCCDGSDEAGNPNAECEDICGSLAKKSDQLKKSLRNITNIGERLRQKYSDRGRTELSVRRHQLQYVKSAKENIFSALSYVERIHYEIMKGGDYQGLMVGLRNSLNELQHNFDDNLQDEFNIRKQGRKIKTEDPHRGKFNLKKRAQRNFNVENAIIYLKDFSLVFENIEQAYNICRTFQDSYQIGQDPPDFNNQFNKLNSITSKIENSTQKVIDDMNLDFGMDKEYLPLYKQWYYFEKDDWYVIFHPYDNVTKYSSKDGHQIWDFGHYNYTKTLRWYFSGGSTCKHNRPGSDMEIRLHCRLKDEILNVHEYEDCHSRLDFGTPAACSSEYTHQINQMSAETLDEWAREAGLIK
ncbi:hypothetical protein TVAG_150160 [Trichomonas vaginalis G3]|uniref:Glucosidase 2 subunit beta n=1 Tax=Trichomonas vaginalis (strain ATCC PRA-98 / G3) TaxID=412133 RepID=A2DRR8_TRIV3|nr:N-glycan processing [Trichomonas vaginalis G3]EAY16865.1 hypothetical protein TVAG_150160 [Trichomonas vaginalis G3]KAI5489148.1 N-glycan processing [Trichomonas vaginalis G3]|eukprot:XP_001329088.1 hypothetical protein [Trichomonas vaginalis G3]